MPTSKTIPTVDDGTAYYTIVSRMDGRDFQLRFAWNEIDSRWYLDILDVEGTALVTGLKLVANRPLLRFYQWDTRLPPGDLRVMDLSGNEDPPGFLELAIGKRCELTYFPITDL